jgi:hypothetical protein
MRNPIAQFVFRSGNMKTGPISTLSYPRESCPTDCPLINGGGCYGDSGFHTRLNWNYLDAGQRGAPFSEALQAAKRLPAGSLVRDKVVGDEFGELDNPDNIDADLFRQKLRAFKKLRVISYTHRKLNRHNLALLREAKAQGLNINLSADDLKAADKKARHHLPVVVVVPSDTPKVSKTPEGRKVVICPAQTSDRVTCATCALCADGSRDYLIGFRAHGNQSKKINARLAAA